MAETYLRDERCLNGAIPATIRFLSRAWHSESGKNLPAMIAAIVSPGGALTGVQLTYLDEAGHKAEVRPVRRNRGVLTGSAVRLGPAGDRLIVCEGIEDGLTVQEAWGLPAWATLGAAGLVSVRIPDYVSEVVIAADRDEPGERAAQELARRLAAEGRRVKIARPPSSFKDWNEMAVSCGRAG